MGTRQLLSRWFHWLCEIVTRRDCRERTIAVRTLVRDVRAAHATRLKSHRKLEEVLRQL